jgi:Sec-independent protein secretion pathway component TatC
VVASEADGAGAVPWTPAEALRVAVAVVGIAALAWAIPAVVWQASVVVSLNPDPAKQAGRS